MVLHKQSAGIHAGKHRIYMNAYLPNNCAFLSVYKSLKFAFPNNKSMSDVGVLDG